MHILTTATIVLVLALVGVELSVAAFVNPAALRLDPEPQLKLLSSFAFALGRVMPVWYPLCTLLLGLQTWLYRHTPDFGFLLTATVLWVLASLASIALLIPLNNRIAAGDADWQRIHRLWDRRHRVRTAALAVAAILFTYAVVQ